MLMMPSRLTSPRRISFSGSVVVVVVVTSVVVVADVVVVVVVVVVEEVVVVEAVVVVVGTVCVVVVVTVVVVVVVPEIAVEVVDVTEPISPIDSNRYPYVSAYASAVEFVYPRITPLYTFTRLSCSLT